MEYVPMDIDDIVEETVHEWNVQIVHIEPIESQFIKPTLIRSDFHV